MDVVVGTCTTVLQYANFSIQQLETFHHLALTNPITPSRAFLSTILVTSSMFGENEFSSMFSGRVTRSSCRVGTFFLLLSNANYE